MIKNPNQSLWQQYSEQGHARGELVARLLSEFTSLQDCRILDAGCGYGGISRTLYDYGARVTAIDPDADRIRALQSTLPGMDCHCTGIESYNTEKSFDIIILNDVLEHVTDPEQVLLNCKNMLNPFGLLYLVTPNKYAPLNLLCDPHYSLPLAALLPRPWVRTLIGKMLRWHAPTKPDFPELLSLFRLAGLLKKSDYNWQFINVQAANLALENPEYIWSRKWHLRTIHTIKQFNLDKIFLNFVSDRKSINNYLINPTWYILAKRNE